MRQHVALGEAQLRQVAALILGLNPTKKWRIQIGQERERRTLSQNRRYWVAITAIAETSGHSPDEVHDAMKTKFLTQSIVNLGGEEIYIPASTPKLDVAEMSDYIEKVIAFAATEFGVLA